MKVLFLNTFERNGGAGIAGFRLFNALRNDHKADVEYLFQFEGDFKKYQIKNLPALLRIGIEKSLLRNKLLNSSDIFKFETGQTGVTLKRNAAVRKADILHLHWVNQGFLSMKTIQELAAAKPIVWTLHDMWAFTGGCAYSNECTRYINSCGQCPFLRLKREHDLSNEIWNKKKEIYKTGKITWVCPSQWMANRAKESSLGKYAEVVMIPNPIDTDFFCPDEMSLARKALGLNREGIIFLFGAQNIDDERKGFQTLQHALKIIKDASPKVAEKITLLVFGGTSNKNKFVNISVPVKYLGTLTRAEEIKLAYQASGYYIHCSYMDNLPNTIAESLSCGIPVIAFNTGGISELVQDGFNGFLAGKADPGSLAEAMIKSIDSPELIRVLGNNARQTAVNKLSMKQIAGSYYSLYEKVLAVN